MSAWFDRLLPELRHAILCAEVLRLRDVAAAGQTCRQMRAEIGTWLGLQEQPLGTLTTTAIRRHLRRRLLLECWRAGQVGPGGATPLGAALCHSGLPMSLVSGSNGAFVQGVFWRAILPDVHRGYAMQLVALPYFAWWNGWDYDCGIGAIDNCGNDDMILVHRVEGKHEWPRAIRPWKWIIHVVEWDTRTTNGHANIMTSSSLKGVIDSYPLLPRLSCLYGDPTDCLTVADTHNSKTEKTIIYVSRKKLPNTYWRKHPVFDWDAEARAFDQ